MGTDKWILDEESEDEKTPDRALEKLPDSSTPDYTEKANENHLPWLNATVKYGELECKEDDGFTRIVSDPQGKDQRPAKNRRRLVFEESCTHNTHSIFSCFSIISLCGLLLVLVSIFLFQQFLFHLYFLPQARLKQRMELERHRYGARYSVSDMV